MLIDAVTFGGEVDMLRARLETLPADLFVVVESNRHYAGQPKPYTFEDNLDVLSKWMSKIHYVRIEGLGSGDAWANDFHQRRMVGETLEGLELNDTDLVCAFDTDEFWDVTKLRPELHAWQMPKYHMSLFWFHFNELTGISGEWGTMRGRDIDRLRWSRNGLPKINGGFHLTSMGSLDYLVKKVRGFAHQEYNQPGLEERLEHCWTYGHNLEGQQFTELPDLSHLPEWFGRRLLPSDWYRRRPHAV